MSRSDPQPSGSDPQPLFPAPGPAPLVGEVVALGQSLHRIQVDGRLYPAQRATHVPPLALGQRVAVLAGTATDPLLIIAAWPLPDAPPEPVAYDPASRTLRIQAARLELTALEAVELHCGPARLRLSLDGAAALEGETLLTSAIGTHRLEGAAIELN